MDRMSASCTASEIIHNYPGNEKSPQPTFLLQFWIIPSLVTLLLMDFSEKQNSSFLKKNL